jgi:hypothetical protein
MCNVQRETQCRSAVARGSPRRLFDHHQERDGCLGVRAEGEHIVAGEQDGLGSRSFRDQLGALALGPSGLTRGDAAN